VLARQLRSPLLLLLAVTAFLSYLVGERSDAIIIGLILSASVSLGFTNEYRAALAAEALKSRLTHDCTVWREGKAMRIPVTGLVPGDLVEIRLGDIVPADLSIIEATDLACDESMLTGEPLPVEKDVDALASMGTVVHDGSGRGIVTSTGADTAFGRIAAGLADDEPPTAFQRGLTQFSMLLVRIATLLTGAIFVTNLILHRPIIDAILFSLAIAIGISPQLLPAVVSTSMTRGAHRLARRKVLVKRLVCIEDLGDIETLFTDKTGTLTEGSISFDCAIDTSGEPAGSALRLGAICTEVTILATGSLSGNPLDVALLRATPLPPTDIVDRRAFSHGLRTTAVVVRLDDGRFERIEKGAPEAIFASADEVDPGIRAASEREMRAGNRVVAVTRTHLADGAVGAAPTTPVTVVGLLVFRDPPKESAGTSLARLAELGVEVRIVTGDAPQVAQHLCAQFGLAVDGVLDGEQVDALSDRELTKAIPVTRIFARVSPEQKARIVRLHHEAGNDVAFMGDGVNDALAIHQADVGISVESASDVAKDAADVVLLEKDLGVLADGVIEGRRIFANTTKYILMGTSSNFGNMFSAAAASAFLTFLPMLPSQILLNNLLYDASQLAIPTDEVDEDQLARPAEWDIAHIRRYMLMMGPLSSLFDFLTFALMLQVFHAGPAMFRTGWFVESLATQTLIVFVIRTARTPFWRSKPSWQLATAVGSVVVVGALLPLAPFAQALGFVRLGIPYFLALVGMVVVYALIVDRAKRWAIRPLMPSS
jgi:Mg2+-importing ATPase